MLRVCVCFVICFLCVCVFMFDCCLVVVVAVVVCVCWCVCVCACVLLLVSPVFVNKFVCVVLFRGVFWLFCVLRYSIVFYVPVALYVL